MSWLLRLSAAAFVEARLEEYAGLLGFIWLALLFAAALPCPLPMKHFQAPAEIAVLAVPSTTVLVLPMGRHLKMAMATRTRKMMPTMTITANTLPGRTEAAAAATRSRTTATTITPTTAGNSIPFTSFQEGPD